MKKKIITYFLIFINVNCLSRTATLLKETPLKTFEKNFSKIKIKVQNPEKHKLNIQFYIQDKESFEKNDSQFLPIYYFDESFKDDEISFSIPKGSYYGFLQITTKKNFPLYKSISGSNILYFGLNKDLKRNKIDYKICEKSMVNGFRFSEISSCNFINFEKEEISINYSLGNQLEFNLSDSILKTWFSFSYAFLQGPQQYPYAVFLIINVPFGFYSEDLLISLDNLNNF